MSTETGNSTDDGSADRTDLSRSARQEAHIASAQPRLQPLRDEEWEEPARTVLLADLGEGSPLGARRLSELRVFTTLARHPKLFTPWMAFARRLLVRGELEAADRELLILRTAYNCRAEYEWGQHVVLAMQAGLTEADVAGIASDAPATGWGAKRRLLLCAADELHRHQRVSDDTWRGLADHLSERQLIEVPVLVGHYVMLAYALNSFGVEPEAGLEPLPIVSDQPH